MTDLWKPLSLQRLGSATSTVSPCAGWSTDADDLTLLNHIKPRAASYRTVPAK